MRILLVLFFCTFTFMAHAQTLPREYEILPVGNGEVQFMRGGNRVHGMKAKALFAKVNMY